MIAFADRTSKSPAPARKGQRKASKSIDFPALVVLIQAAAGQLNVPADVPAVRPGGRLAALDRDAVPADASHDGPLAKLVDAELTKLAGTLPTLGQDEVRATL